MTIGCEVSRSSMLASSSSATFRANRSARVLEQRELVLTRTSRVSPSGSMMTGPPRSSRIPPSADPSVQIHVASSGRLARRFSAVLRRKSGEGGGVTATVWVDLQGEDSNPRGFMPWKDWRLGSSVSKLRKLGGKVSVTGKIYTSSKNSNYIHQTVSSLSNH